MTTGASKGLQKALARAGSSVLAIAEMQAGDLLAELTDEQKTALAAELGPAASASAAPATAAAASAAASDGGEGEGEEGEDDDEPAPPAAASASASGAQAGERARVKAVAKAVAEDETCKGKADLALQMLADDDYAGLSASGIVKLLGKQPAPTTAANDPDAAARAEMQNAIAETGNSGIDASGGAGGGKGANAEAIWDQAIAANNPGQRKPA